MPPASTSAVVSHKTVPRGFHVSVLVGAGGWNAPSAPEAASSDPSPRPDPAPSRAAAGLPGASAGFGRTLLLWNLRAREGMVSDLGSGYRVGRKDCAGRGDWMEGEEAVGWVRGEEGVFGSTGQDGPFHAEHR